MKNYKDKIISAVKIVTLAAVLSVGVSYVLAQSWEPPAGPSYEAHPPLNVSSQLQIKSGGLWSETLFGAPFICLDTGEGLKCIEEWPEGECVNGINSITVSGSQFQFGCL